MNDTPSGPMRFRNTRTTNAPMRDPRLSLRAKGLLAVMLSVPDNTPYKMTQVQAVSDDNAEEHALAFKELEAAGYARVLDTGEYCVSDSVLTVEDMTARGKAKPSKSKKEPAQVPAALAARPTWAEAWAAWLAYRKERRLATAPSTITRQLNFLTGQPDPEACIEQSITNGWNGLFEVRRPGRAQTTVDANHRFAQRVQGNRDAVKGVFDE